MRKKVWIGLCIWLALFAKARAEIIDRVVAVVNDEVITLSELDEACLPYFQKYLPGIKDPLEEEQMVRRIRQEVLERLIEEKLISQELQKYHIQVSDQEVEDFVQNMVRQMGGEERFREFLAAQGLTLMEYREKVREQIRKLKLIQGSVRARIVITDEDLRRYYKEHYLSGNQRVYVLAAIVNQDQNKIKEAAQELSQGKSFQEVARRYSELPGSGEGLGSFKLEELAPEVRKILLDMKPGEVSPPVKVGETWQIFKVLEIKEEPPVPFEEVKEEIYQKLYQKELDEYFKKWLKELKENAFIKVLL